MIIFKFGGASVKDAKAVKNVCSIVSKYKKESILIVVSAMGKTTNAIEKILLTEAGSDEFNTQFDDLKDFHSQIAIELFNQEEPIFNKLEDLFSLFKKKAYAEQPYDFRYDQLVSFGELISTTILAAYLQKYIPNVIWHDSRKSIKTNNQYRNGKVDWDLTASNIDVDLKPVLDEHIIVTQGFIGSCPDGFTTTLGREGSDFTAAIYASCLNAKEVVIWKDVPGILSADPKMFDDAVLYDELPYKEAAEMTYYGASVIHPKTIKPLANKDIPLLVKSFIDPESKGTKIHDCQPDHLHSAVIVKKNQCLLSLKLLDYSFVNEDNLSVIFEEVANADVKINLMQNSAISFSLALDHDRKKLDKLIGILRDTFEIRYNTGLTLLTIKNYKPEMIKKYVRERNILLEQTSRNNYRALVV